MNFRVLMNPKITKTVFQTTIFSDDPGGGNPYSVVLDADEFSTQQGCEEVDRRLTEFLEAPQQLVPNLIPFPVRLRNYVQEPRWSSQL